MSFTHSVESVHHIFETLMAHLKENDKLLNTDGIFRVSSSGATHLDLARAIAKGESINLEDFSAYDCANALKAILYNTSLLPEGDPRVKAYCVRAREIYDTDTIQHGTVFLDFIKQLEGGSATDQKIAQIYNWAIEISQMTALKEQHNRMSPNNLAIVWVPGILNSMNTQMDPMTQLGFIPLITADMTNCIESGLNVKLDQVLQSKQSTIQQANTNFDIANRFMSVASSKLVELSGQLIKDKTILEEYRRKMESGKLPKDQRKVLESIVKELEIRLESLETLMRQNKQIAQKQLSIVVKHESYIKDLRSSCERLTQLQKGASASDLKQDSGAKKSSLVRFSKFDLKDPSAASSPESASEGKSTKKEKNRKKSSKKG